MVAQIFETCTTEPSPTHRSLGIHSILDFGKEQQEGRIPPQHEGSCRVLLTIPTDYKFAQLSVSPTFRQCNPYKQSAAHSIAKLYLQ